MSQGRYWLLTIPHHEFLPYLPDGCTYIRGQLESGSGTGYLHWQILVAFGRAVRLAAVKRIFGTACHAELSRSNAADQYVHKDDTAVPNTRFCLGERPIKRNSKVDWKLVHDHARAGRIDAIPADVQVRHFGSLLRIGAYFARPEPMVRRCFVFWGESGMGKSRMAWERGGLESYPKIPSTKFWDGYRGQSTVIIDEFRGGIGIEHLLRWLDRYPVLVEIKGSAVPLVAKEIYITSNLHPNQWYPNLDTLTLNALLRRLEITHFDGLTLTE